jgi:hypothetical protein
MEEQPWNLRLRRLFNCRAWILHPSTITLWHGVQYTYLQNNYLKTLSTCRSYPLSKFDKVGILQTQDHWSAVLSAISMGLFYDDILLDLITFSGVSYKNMFNTVECQEWSSDSMYVVFLSRK